MGPHLPIDSKKAVVEAAARLEQKGTSRAEIVSSFARQYSVHPQTIRNWLAAKGIDVPKKEALDRNQLSLVFACSGNLTKAHQLAMSRGVFSGSLSSFRRRFHATDTDITAAVRHGMPAMIQRGLYNVTHGSSVRGDAFHFDHTEIPVEVLYRSKRTKVWVSLMVDEASSFIFRPVFTTGQNIKGDPNTTTIIAAVGGVMIGEEFDGEMVGGIPGAFVFDNARAHLADAVMNGFATVGVRGKTIRPGSPWENGVAEAAVKTIEVEVWSQLPGYTHAPKTRYDKSPWSDDDLLSYEELIAVTVTGVERVNRSIPLSRHNGKTRFAVWRDDPHHIEFAEASTVRHAFTATPKTRVVQKKGVFHRNGYYTAEALAGHVGRKVKVRFVPGNETFIDVYLDDQFLCTAVPHESMSIEKRRRLARTRTNRVGRARVIQKMGATAAREEAERQVIEAQLQNLTTTDDLEDVNTDDVVGTSTPPAFDAYLQRGTK